MFSTNCCNGSISTSCSFICTPHHNSSRPTNALSNSYHSLAIEVTTTSAEELRNKRYKDKCTRLQKQIHQLVYINSAVQSELNVCYDKLKKAQEERRYLLNKILHSNKDINQETISSRILQEALSKKSTKHVPHSPSSQSTSYLSLTDNNHLFGSQCLSNQSTLSPKPQSDKLPISQTNNCEKQTLKSQSHVMQTISSDMGPDVGPNKRTKSCD